jgi:trans-aconitate 2-methyltransferase
MRGERKGRTMAGWSATQYLKFRNERTRPAIDLASRIEHDNPKKIIDIGCGPGNSTKVLADRFGSAYILGVDNSENMILRAGEECPALNFMFFDINGDLSGLDHDFDIVFSNACIQWVPNHEVLLPRLAGLLKSGGVLAVQIPYNWQEPVHRIIREVASSPGWKEYFPNPVVFHTLTVGEYFDILSEISTDFTIWETVYYHVMRSHRDILEWYRGTGMRPYLDELSEGQKMMFEDVVLRKLMQSYPVQKNGEIIFRFPRLFFTARV